LLVRRYHIDDAKITSIYHDLDESRDPHAIDSTLIHEWQMILGADRRKILYYGHAGASKGVDTLIDALARFLPDHPDALFVANITASRGRDSLIHTIQKKLPAGSYHIETGMERHRLQ
jgi:glycosyltransferase involved in cell wall biosynthesis